MLEWVLVAVVGVPSLALMGLVLPLVLFLVPMVALMAVAVTWALE